MEGIIAPEFTLAIKIPAFDLIKTHLQALGLKLGQSADLCIFQCEVYFNMLIAL